MLRRRPAPPPEFPDRARPLPEGWSEAYLYAVMRTIRVDEGTENELEGYIADAFFRFLHTWGMVRQETGRALELGANPYFTTSLLAEFTDLDLQLANYFGASGTDLTQKVSFRDREGTTREMSLTGAQFNMEEDRFPYEDDSFDVVLFCEIIEHLLMDPMHSLREIHRVLRPGGLLVTTTPNVVRLGNVLSMVAGENIYDPYSGHGPYGRHNREYTLHELVHLLRFAGFDVESSFTANAHPETFTHRYEYERVAPTLTFRGTISGSTSSSERGRRVLRAPAYRRSCIAAGRPISRSWTCSHPTDGIAARSSRGRQPHPPG